MTANSNIAPIKLSHSILIFGGAALMFLLFERVILPYLGAQGVNRAFVPLKT